MQTHWSSLLPDQQKIICILKELSYTHGQLVDYEEFRDKCDEINLSMGIVQNALSKLHGYTKGKSHSVGNSPYITITDEGMKLIFNSQKAIDEYSRKYVFIK